MRDLVHARIRNLYLLVLRRYLMIFHGCSGRTRRRCREERKEVGSNQDGEEEQQGALEGLSRGGRGDAGDREVVRQ